MLQDVTGCCVDHRGSQALLPVLLIRAHRDDFPHVWRTLPDARSREEPRSIKASEIENAFRCQPVPV